MDLSSQHLMAWRKASSADDNVEIREQADLAASASGKMGMKV